ncbi:hypothetical protein PR048_011286 [Dryococelus australis]|uniref:Uncharacterized protein n=1 Tax=Dryococelus australis TaxID=614101 RepID=A0ABQ9HL48_9NEOP|nr:hypothetical protein PR048_011286 [Dryococelus australis]
MLCDSVVNYCIGYYVYQGEKHQVDQDSIKECGLAAMKLMQRDISHWNDKEKQEAYSICIAETKKSFKLERNNTSNIMNCFFGILRKKSLRINHNSLINLNVSTSGLVKLPMKKKRECCVCSLVSKSQSGKRKMSQTICA